MRPDARPPDLGTVHVAAKQRRLFLRLISFLPTLDNRDTPEMWGPFRPLWRLMFQSRLLSDKRPLLRREDAVRPRTLSPSNTEFIFCFESFLLLLCTLYCEKKPWKQQTGGVGLEQGACVLFII